MNKTQSKTKIFFKYFWSTFKESKFLLLKYVAVAVLYSVISILANLLNVKELTYLNAFLSLYAFASIIAFGIGNAISVFMNQNISSKFKVRKYAKIGFEINIIFSFIVTALLVLFPRFFMETLMGYNPESYTFYYIMCGYFFLSCTSSYLVETMKCLKFFKQQFVCEITPLIITILGFLILYFCGIYYLNYIAIAYILGTVFSMTFSIILLMKNKEISVNFFKLQTINLTKRQWWILLSNLAVEFIWQIGYYATSIILIRFSDGIFNTYSYLENVLDVFNSFLFAFSSVSAIRITRCLGRNQFDKAYTYAKQSIVASILIWCFYFVASMALIYPIALGVNREYFSLMFTVMPCYVAIHFFRFIAWNMGSYMLRLGGKNTIFVIIEFFCSVILVSMCFIVQFLPVSVPLAYLIILIPTLLFLPVYFIIFKRKKWLCNINEDPNLISNQVKVTIFDFRDTLIWDMKKDNHREMNMQWFNEHFSYMSERERAKLLKKYGCGPNGEGLSSQINEMLFDIEGNNNSYLIFREFTETNENYIRGKHISNKELEKFKKLGKIYIVSNWKEKDLQRAVDYNEFDRNLFAGIISNNISKKENLDKYKIYKKIMKDNNLKANQILVVGNNFKHDLRSAKKLGMHYYLVKDGFTYDEIMT